MPKIANFPVSQPGQSKPYAVDLTPYIPAGTGLASVIWDLSVDRTVAGAQPDPSPGSHLVGDHTESGNITTQQIGSLVAGNDYVVQITFATDAGVTVVLWGILPCRVPGTGAILTDAMGSRLAALKAAREMGVLTVRSADSTTTYRSLAEMDEIIAGLESQVGSAVNPQPIRRLRLLATKGL